MRIPEHIVERWIYEDEVADYIFDLELKRLVNLWGERPEQDKPGDPHSDAWAYYDRYGYGPDLQDDYHRTAEK